MAARESSMLRLSGSIAALMVLGLTAAQAQTPPANDDIAQATALGAAPSAAHFNLYGATTTSGDPTSCSSSPFMVLENTVWFSYTPVADQALDVTVTSAWPYLALAVYSGTPEALTPASCDAYLTASNGITTRFSAQAGQTYYVEVAADTFPVDTPAPSNIQLSLAPPAVTGTVLLGSTVTASKSWAIDPERPFPFYRKQQITLDVQLECGISIPEVWVSATVTQGDQHMDAAASIPCVGGVGQGTLVGVANLTDTNDFEDGTAQAVATASDYSTNFSAESDTTPVTIRVVRKP